MKQTCVWLLFLALLSMMLAPCGVCEAPSIEVVAPSGTYIGNDNDGVAEFLGIRYGEMQPFMPATDVTTTYEDRIEARAFAFNCIQPYNEVEIASHDPCSQDCLYLNVWTRDTATAGKPVIMFIHGGSCIWGGTSDPTYDGEYFVRNLSEDCVFVTINYRMSIFGGLDLSSLEGYTDDYYSAINLSKLDQTQALKWIHENIEAFGGDPENVTIMGQSAGGGAVEMLMADPSTHAYFHRAIINSGTQSREAVSRETVASNSQKVFEILGVSSIEELIGMTDEQFSDKMLDITDALGRAHPGLKCADGKIISETWWEDLENGTANDIDLLIGGTNGEEDWNAIDWDNSVSEPLTEPDSILAYIEETDTVRANGYGRFYPTLKEGFVEGYLAMGEDKVMQAMDLHNDAYFNYPTMLIAETQSRHNPNTYLYAWEYAPAMEEVLEYSGDSAEVSPWGRALHCMDLCFEFGTKDGYTEMTGDPEKMSDDMIRRAGEMVYSFAATGNPGVEGWQPYTEDGAAAMLIAADGSWQPVDHYREEAMDYMRQLEPFGCQ